MNPTLYIYRRVLSILSFLQICSGIDENAVGACSELVFAPIDEMFPDDAPLLPSGFRVIPLDSKSVRFHCLSSELFPCFGIVNIIIVQLFH